MIKLNKWSLER